MAVSDAGMGFGLAIAGIFGFARLAKKHKEQQTLIFTYGTLKRGFPNHNLLESMLYTGEASYRGTYKTLDKFPLMCGPFKVPFLLNFPGSGHRVLGEIYAVTPAALARIDEFEGISKGHYERLPVEVEFKYRDDYFKPLGYATRLAEEKEMRGKEVVRAEAYFAHRSFAEEMLRRGGEFFGIYTQKEAAGYVKPAKRPPHVPFMDQIRLFLSSPSPSSSSSGPVLRP